jgi:hypothetical protein
MRTRLHQSACSTLFLLALSLAHPASAQTAPPEAPPPALTPAGDVTAKADTYLR